MRKVYRAVTNFELVLSSEDETEIATKKDELEAAGEIVRIEEVTQFGTAILYTTPPSA